MAEQSPSKASINLSFNKKRRSDMTITRQEKLKHHGAARYLTFCIQLIATGLLADPYLAEGPRYDVLIMNGHILDGSGSPWLEGSVAVKEGNIAAVGRLPNETPHRVVGKCCWREALVLS
jgi:hypothetical protein